jgi:acetyl-CoA carboxylase carboxyltransferase component
MVRMPGGKPPRFGGIIYTESAEKVAYFIETCTRHQTPLLFVQDVSGFMVGPDAEHSGIIRAGAKFVEAMATATVPKIVLTVNHASGAGYYAMAGQGFDPDFIYSWPTGRMGVMEGDSAVQAVFGSQLEKLKKNGESPDAELTAEMDKVRNMQPHADSSTRLLHPNPLDPHWNSHCAPRKTTPAPTSASSFCHPLCLNPGCTF